MPTYVVKLKGKYLLWSTVVDAPVSYAMSLEEFKSYYREEYGESGMRELPARMARVEAKGTSALIYDSAEELVRHNRAGKNETSLSVAALLREYSHAGDRAEGQEAK